jgi:hypothetical protein
MKKVLYCVFLLGGFISLAESCKKEKVKGCTNSLASNYDVNAEEDNGTCIFERDKFLGNWLGLLANTNNPGIPDTTYNFPFSIAVNPNNYKDVFINDFPVSGAPSNASVNSTNRFSLVIPKQNITSGLDSFGISGIGQISDDQIVFLLLKELPGILDTISVTALKQ